jgi:endoglucanase
MIRKQLILLALAAILVPATASAADPRGVDRSDPNPLAGETFYNQPDAPAMNEWRHLERIGKHGEADLIWKIASQPKAMWFGRFTRPNFFEKVRRRIDPARARGEVPIFTVLRAQATGCSPSYQGGGPGEDRRTMNWYDELARAIGNDRVVVAFEPDSLGTIDCLAPSRRDDRYRVLAHGVDVLSRLPNVTLYIEAGASDWENAKRTAKQLRIVGVGKARGFMLNVTHYDWTANNIKHGLEISRLTGGKHFIINTAENGRGGVHYKKWISRSRHIWRRITVWCNPGLRGLGPNPTT